MLEFAEEGRDTWDFTQLEDPNLQNMETCSVSTDGSIGGSTGGPTGESTGGLSDESTDGPTEDGTNLCLRKRRRK